MPQDHAFYDATQHYDSTPQPRPGASAVNSTIDGSQQTQHRQTQARGTNQNSQELTEDEDLWSFVDLLQQQSTAGPGSNQLNAPLSLLGDIIPPTTLNNTDVYHPIPWDASTYNLEPFSTHASGIQFPTHDGLDAHTCPADQLANTPPPMINIHPPFNYPGPPSNSSAPPVSVGPVDPTPASYFQALTHQQHSQASSPQPSAAPGLPQPTTSQKRRRSTSLADSIPRAGAGDDEDVYWQVPASHRARCPRTACPAPAPTQIPAPNLQGVIPLPHQNPQSSRLPQVIATVLPHRTERDGDGFEHLEPSPGLITSHDNQWSCVTASTPGAVGGAAAYPLAVPAASGLPSTPSPDPSLVHPQTFIRQPSLAPSVDSQGSYTPSVSQSASQGQAPAPSNHPARPRRARPPPLRQVPSAEPPSAGPSMRILDFRRLSAADAIRGTPQSSPSAYGSFPRTPVSAQGSNASYEAMIQDNRHMDFVRYPSATPSSAPPHRYSHAPLTPVDVSASTAQSPVPPMTAIQGTELQTPSTAAFPLTSLSDMECTEGTRKRPRTGDTTSAKQGVASNKGKERADAPQDPAGVKYPADSQRHKRDRSTEEQRMRLLFDTLGIPDGFFQPKKDRLVHVLDHAIIQRNNLNETNQLVYSIQGEADRFAAIIVEKEEQIKELTKKLTRAYDHIRTMGTCEDSTELATVNTHRTDLHLSWKHIGSGVTSQDGDKHTLDSRLTEIETSHSDDYDDISDPS